MTSYGYVAKSDENNNKKINKKVLSQDQANILDSLEKELV